MNDEPRFPATCEHRVWLFDEDNRSVFYCTSSKNAAYRTRFFHQHEVIINERVWSLHAMRIVISDTQKGLHCKRTADEMLYRDNE